MDLIFNLLTPTNLAICMSVALLAGMVKGIVGFAMPMIMISGLSAFVAPEIALAALILPTLLTNGIQAMRQGLAEAWASVRRFRVFLIVGLVVLLGSAQLVAILDQQVLLLLIGSFVVAFCLMQLLGWKPRLSAPSQRIEAGVAAVAGFIGGLSGVWGPPTVAYLTAIDTPKAEQMRVQGVIYGGGALALAGAHLQSGILNAQTVQLSAAMIPPALVGMWIGFQFQDRIDQRMFRRATLVVLLVAGLNLLRRGLIG